MAHGFTGSAIQATESSVPSQVTPAKGNKLTVEEAAALKRREEESKERERKRQIKEEYEKMRRNDGSELTTFPSLDTDIGARAKDDEDGRSLMSKATSPVGSLWKGVEDRLANTFGFPGHGPVPSASESKRSTATQASDASKEK